MPRETNRLQTWRKSTEKETARIQELLELAKISSEDVWDHLLVGDGSGSTKDRAAGWACIDVSRQKGLLGLELYHAAANRGTNNFAEIMAYVQPLWSILGDLIDHPPGRFITIHVFTDSEYAQQTGNAVAKGALPGKNNILWEVFRVAHRAGVRMKWHWLGRTTHGFNRYTDDLSRRSRVEFDALDLMGKMATIDKIFPGSA